MGPTFLDAYNPRGSLPRIPHGTIIHQGCAAKWSRAEVRDNPGKTMAIAVSCKQCGKTFKAKDELAGKAVRCPGCQAPLKIPAAAAAPAMAKSSAGPASSAKSSSDAAIEAALAKVEAARQKRAAVQSESEAKKEEVLKIAEEFDKVSPKSKEAKEAEKKGKKEGPPEKIGEKPKKVTAMMRIADVFGMIKGSAAAKITLLTLFIVGGATGSTLFIKRIMSATHEATSVEKIDDAGIEKLYVDAEKAAKGGNWSRVRDCLEDIIRAQPYRKNNFRYKALKEQLEKAVGGGG